ncbi:MAG: class I SAM-dependent methyltransferase [Rubricella sp.]
MRRDLQQTFSDATWARPRRGVPRSGPGSTLEHTALLRDALPDLLRRHGVSSLLDAPCGDWTWMREVDLAGVHYTGLDIVPAIVEANRNAFGGEAVAFAVADLTSDPLPRADLLLCRDCLFHLVFDLRWAFFENFLASGTPLLLTTTYSNPRNRVLEKNGDFQFFNMTAPPFSFPEPLERIEDDKPGRRSRFARFMGLWHRDQIAARLKEVARERG